MYILFKIVMNKLISPIIAVSSAIITHKPSRGDIIAQ
jgi:hypothetical protein